MEKVRYTHIEAYTHTTTKQVYKQININTNTITNT